MAEPRSTYMYKIIATRTTNCAHVAMYVLLCTCCYVRVAMHMLLCTCTPFSHSYWFVHVLSPRVNALPCCHGNLQTDSTKKCVIGKLLIIALGV